MKYLPMPIVLCGLDFQINESDQVVNQARDITLKITRILAIVEELLLDINRFRNAHMAAIVTMAQRAPRWTLLKTNQEPLSLQDFR